MSESKKKILIVCKGFYPVNSPRAFRATELAREFSRQGHEVTVLTPRDSNVHDTFERENDLTIRDLGKLKWKEAALKGSGAERLIRRAMRRLPMIFFEYPDIELYGKVKKALYGQNGYDLMISIAVPYPIHWGISAIRSSRNPIAKTWVADCGDPYLGGENQNLFIPFYFSFFEKRFCRKADYITVPVPGAVQGYFPEFHPKIRIIPQGFRFEDIPVDPNPPQNSRPVFAYAGSFIPGRRDPSEFLQWLVQQDFDYEFHVYTHHTHLVLPYIIAAKGKIILKNYVPRPELLRTLQKMDFVVNFDNVGKIQVPSKLIDYAILGKPILNIKTGSLDVDTVKQFFAGDYTRRYIVEDVDQYRIENVCKTFLNLCENG